MKLVCKRCIYHQLERGECRRYPPTLHSGGISSWPTVEDDDWCGEGVRVISEWQPQRGPFKPREAVRD